MYICNKCNKTFSKKSSLSNHIKYCDGRGSILDIKRNKFKGRNLTCHKCKRKFSNNQALSQHEKYCNGEIKDKRKYGSHKDYGNFLKGKSYEEIYGYEKAISIKEKLSKSTDGIKSWNNMTEEQKEIHAERARKNILKRYDEGWEPKAGRSPKYKYKNFTVDGSWELEFCKWADDNGLYFEKNYDRFDYFFNGKWRKYKPDFKIDDNTYVEIKGYQTNKDLAKWRYFDYNLIILKKNQIKRIKKRTFKKDELYEYIMEGGQDGNAADC